MCAASCLSVTSPTAPHADHILGLVNVKKDEPEISEERRIVSRPLGFLLAIRLVQVFSCTETSRVHSDAYEVWIDSEVA